MARKKGGRSQNKSSTKRNPARTSGAKGGAYSDDPSAVVPVRRGKKRR